MCNKTVNVLISTYNGEQFIGQQIESILNQSYENIHIYIRDDGSKDNTIDEIEQYMPSGKVTLIKGNNIGYARSFMELLCVAEEGMYWAFCDQDDVWFQDKIKWSVEWLEKQDESKPCLFHGAYENVDINLEHLSEYNCPDYEYDFRRAMTECLYFGFSMVINSKLRELMMQADIKNIISHDWWATLIAVKFGIVEFDSRIASQHRRHNQSVTLLNNRRKIQWLIKSIKAGNEVGNNAFEFKRVFQNSLTKKELQILDLFIKKDFLTNLKKAFYPKRWRPTWDSEIAIRLLMLLGKN